MSNSNNNFIKGFQALGGRIIEKDFIGFDVETYVNEKGENEFRLCSFIFNFEIKSYYGLHGLGAKNLNNNSITFFTKEECLNFIYEHKRLFQGKYIVATNLQFDLTALFYNTNKWNDLNLCWSNSNLISATIRFNDSNKNGKIIFIDTLNFIKLSVKELGNIIKIPKIEIDKNLFEKKDLSEEELNLMITYNINDCAISQAYMYHIQKTVNDLGGNIKTTIPSTSLDLFRRKFQKETLIKEEKILKDKTITDFIHKSYYGGRTENYNIGEYDNTYYYDVNSLYPYCMLNDFPLSNSVEYGNKTEEEIINYMGVSEVDIVAPEINIPLLPFKTKDKTIFPIGHIHGIYTHILLKKALEIGYKIKWIYKQIIYKQSIPIFKEYVTQLYNIRKQMKQENNIEEQTVKLLMNSLYGKFAQRPQKLYETITIDSMTPQILLKKMRQHYNIIENKEKTLYIMTKETKNYPKNSFPILSSYVTSYAILHMFNLLKNCKPIYTDTDSIITKERLNNDLVGLNLGQFKMEKTGLLEVYQPKNYAFNNIPTIKGLKINHNLSKEEQYKIFTDYNNCIGIKQTNFTKLKSGIKGVKGHIPNQIIEMIKTKRLNGIENKRKFDIDGNSKPIKINSF
jgi:hypothetical protein